MLGQVQLFGGLDSAERNARNRRQYAAATSAWSRRIAVTPRRGDSARSSSARCAYPPAPLLIVAGPGAGKTCTLVERMHWLISEQRITTRPLSSRSPSPTARRRRWRSASAARLAPLPPAAGRRWRPSINSACTMHPRTCGVARVARAADDPRGRGGGGSSSPPRRMTGIGRPRCVGAGADGAISPGPPADADCADRAASSRRARWRPATPPRNARAARWISPICSRCR